MASRENVVLKEGGELSKGFLSAILSICFDLLLSEILVARPRVIGVENKVLSPFSSYHPPPPPPHTHTLSK